MTPNKNYIMPKDPLKPIWNLIVTRILLIFGLVVIVFFSWQIFWKALTPDSLLRLLPSKTTVAAIEQYGYSVLPVVRSSYELLNVKPQLWLDTNYPDIVAKKIDQLHPKRAVQSWQMLDGQLHPLLIVETSLNDYRGQNKSIVSVDVDGQTWFLQQDLPGYYFFTDNQALLKTINTVLLGSTADFIEAQHNLPDQYFAAAYVNPDLANIDALDGHNLPSYLLKQLFEGIGTTFATLTPASNGFTLITYTTPPAPNASYSVSQLRYSAALTKFLPKDPQVFIGGRNFANRYLPLLKDVDFKALTAGLSLPENSLKQLEQLLTKEIAYAKYTDAEFILIDDATQTDYDNLIKFALSLHNYLNPQKVKFTLRDNSFGQKLVPSTLTELPIKASRPSILYLSYNDIKGIQVNWYFSYLPQQRLIVLSTDLDKLTTSESLKDSDLYYQSFLPVLRSSDELSYFNNLALPAPFNVIESITSSKNFFTDGIQTYNQIKLPKLK